MLKYLLIGWTDLFRDPCFYKAVENSVIPYLKTYPFIKVWHAGCATGEEIYSIAILLHEHGVYKKSHIYATDIHSDYLKIASSATYKKESLQGFIANYNIFNGHVAFDDYYEEKERSIKIKNTIRDKIDFFQHNLAIDSRFLEAQIIICRNVLIYFDSDLQKKVLDLLYDSLSISGFLCLGRGVYINFDNRYNFNIVDLENRIYQKIN